MSKHINHALQILEHLQAGHTLTTLEAMNLFNCLRPGARISDLRKAGHKIHTEIIKANGTHYAKYSLTIKPKKNG